MKQNPLRNFTDLSNTEKRGLLAVLIVIAGITAWPWAYSKLYPATFVNKRLSLAEREALAALKAGETKPVKDTFIAEPHFFSFNPNTVADSELLEMGLKPYQVRSIRRYMEKKGGFAFKEQFEHLQVLDTAWVRQASAYNTLPPLRSLYDQRPQRHFPKTDYKTPYKTRPDKPLLDLNTADSQALELLPGIGDWMAGKIVRYRDRLGGFYSINQLAEVRGMRPENMERCRLQLTLSPHRKLNLNTATVDELGKHAYMSYKLARQVVNYRLQHGRITDPAVLRVLPLMADSTYQKMLPYWSTE